MKWVSLHLCLLALNISMIACGSSAIEKWAGKIYVFVPKDLAFERKQDGEIIYAASPDAKPMFCMTESDFNSFLQTYVVNPKTP